MSAPPEPGRLLQRALESGRIHSAFLLAGVGDVPRDAAIRFVRGVVCRGEGERPCGSCRDCLQSGATHEDGEITIDGKSGPFYRRVGDHPDVYWLERAKNRTRVTIGQVRALEYSLRLASTEGGWRAAVIADAEWLNNEAQNALLHLLEEPPERTCIVLVTASLAGLRATVRSRCQKVVFGPAGRPALRSEDADEDIRALTQRLDSIHRAGTEELLDWAEEYRGPRAIAAASVQTLLAVGSEWLRERVIDSVAAEGSVQSELDAFQTLTHCRKAVSQRNANPQMIAERALLAVRSAVQAPA
ncbi:MAG: hypothetical protein VCC20_05675 [Myxococcota bacterium]